MNDFNPYNTSSVVGSQWDCASMGLPPVGQVHVGGMPDPSEPHGFPQEEPVECAKVEGLSDTESDGDQKEYERQPDVQYEIFHSSGAYKDYKEKCLAAAERLFKPVGMNLAYDPKCMQATRQFKFLKTTFELEDRPRCFPEETASDAFDKTRGFARDTTVVETKKRKRGRPLKRTVEMFDVVVMDENASPKRQK